MHPSTAIFIYSYNFSSGQNIGTFKTQGLESTSGYRGAEVTLACLLMIMPQVEAKALYAVEAAATTQRESRVERRRRSGARVAASRTRDQARRDDGETS